MVHASVNIIRAIEFILLMGELYVMWILLNKADIKKGKRQISDFFFLISNGIFFHQDTKGIDIWPH